MTTFTVPVVEDRYFNFRRWLVARDPEARISIRAEGSDIWICTVQTSKLYLKRPSMRRWAL